MQMTYEQALRPGPLMFFATRGGSGYMMRSEKRNGAYGSPNRRPPRRRKAGFFYIFFTLLLSVVLWPIGMVMLWQRKVRMTAGTKLLISLLTLCMSVFLIVFALTVPLDNVEYTAFQDKANDWLDKAAADVAVAGDAAMKKTSETWQAMADFASASTAYASAYTADAIDEGVRAAGQARAAIEDLFHREKAAPEATEAPEVTGEPEVTEAPEVTDEPEVTEAPADTGEPEATEAPAETAQDSRTPEATEAALIPGAGENTKAPAAPRVTVKPEAETSESPAETESAVEILLPETEPKSEDAQPLGEGTLHANGEFEPGDIKTPTDAPAEANIAAPLEEATAVPLKTADPLPTEAPTEEPTEAPTEKPTAAPTEKPTEAPVEEPTEAPVEESTEAPTEAPAETPVEAPTEAPAEAAGVAFTVKPASQATVYFFTNGSKGFHDGPNRHEMKNAPAHTLQEAFDMGKNPCKACGMPDKGILDEAHVAWVDEARRIHTTDECESFKGHWRLMSLDRALAAGYEPCESCGADFYAEEIFPAPTPTPEPRAVSPAVPLKSAGDVTVYYYDSSKGYHVRPDCKGMSDAPAHTLREAADAGKKACGYCNPPATGLLKQAVLWQDENGLCHTSDACAAFAGAYRLVTRDDALAQGLSGCPDCGAAEYLVPGTVLAE